MEDYKLRHLRASHTLGWSWNWRVGTGRVRAQKHHLCCVHRTRVYLLSLGLTNATKL